MSKHTYTPGSWRYYPAETIHTVAKGGIMSNQITDLLHAWASLAKQECKYENDTWFVWRWGTWRRVTLIGRLDEDRIQGALQEAIEKRGWLWTVFTLHVREDYGAYIDIPHEDPDLDDLAGDWDCPSPAHALLSAYVQVLKQQKEVKV